MTQAITIENAFDMLAADLLANTEIAINNAFTRLATARKDYHEAHAATDEARENLTEARAEHILRVADSGVTLGKNEAEREARLASMTTAERLELRLLEENEAKARLNLDLALDEVSRIKLLVAVLEKSA